MSELTKTPEQVAGIRNTLIYIFGFIALILGLLGYSLFMPKALSADALRALGYYEFPQARPLPAFQLTSHLGQPFTNADLNGKFTLMFFGFTFCPDICPTTMGVLNRAVSKLEKPPRVVMVTVDPERDTPDVLSQYVPVFNPEFIGLTGTFDEIVGVATGVNVAFGKVPGQEPGTYTLDHSASIVVLNPAGEYAGFIKAPHQETNIRQIVRSISL